MTEETPPGAPEPPRPAVDIFMLARLGFTLVFGAVTLALAAPFLSSLTWALVLAVVFIRPHRAIESVVGPTFAAALSVLFVALVVLGPLAFVSERLVNEAVSGADYIQQEITQGKWRNFLKTHPWLQQINDWVQGQYDLQDVLGRVGAFLTNAGAMFIKQSTGQALTVLLSFYMLFFLLRDREAGVNALLRLSPFSGRETRKLIVRIRETIYAIIYGTLAVAAMQGALGGIMFWWLNFPSPVFWALIMGLLAIVPVLGTFVVWVPATMFLAIEGRWADAITLGLWGGVVIATSDNLVRPLLISDTLRLHTASAFIAMLGGVQLFGASGLVLGPIALTTASLMLEFLRRRANP